MLKTQHTSSVAVAMILAYRWLNPYYQIVYVIMQGDVYSGAKGHGHCVQIGNITDCRGYLWCITPGNEVLFNHIRFSLDTQIFAKATFLLTFCFNFSHS